MEKQSQNPFAPAIMFLGWSALFMIAGLIMWTFAKLAVTANIEARYQPIVVQMPHQAQQAAPAPQPTSYADVYGGAPRTYSVADRGHVDYVQRGREYVLQSDGTATLTADEQPHYRRPPIPLRQASHLPAPGGYCYTQEITDQWGRTYPVRHCPR